MKKAYRLTTSQPSVSMDTDFEVANIVVDNFTGSPVFIRVGAPDIPSEQNANILVPSGVARSYPVNGYSFAAIMSSPAVAAGANAATSGLFTTCVISLLGADETVPSYGSISAVSLSVSDLSGGIKALTFANPGPQQRSATFDLAPWGGLLVEVIPDPASAQALIGYEISDDGIMWLRVATYPLWPNSPITLSLPHLARYASLVFDDVGLPGASVILKYSARASLIEILQPSFSSIGAEPAITFSAAGASLANTFIYTLGLDYLSLGIEFTSYVVGQPYQVLIQIGPTLAGPWRTVFLDTITITALVDSVTRGLSDLSTYLRIVTYASPSAAIGGNIRFRGRSGDSVASTLATVGQEIGGSLWTGPSVYSQLGDVKTNVNTVNSSVNTVNASIGTSNTQLANLPFMYTELTHIRQSIGALMSFTNAGAVTGAALVQTYLGAALPLVAAAGQSDRIFEVITQITAGGPALLQISMGNFVAFTAPLVFSETVGNLFSTRIQFLTGIKYASPNQFIWGATNPGALQVQVMIVTAPVWD